ncbi:MAG: hypothetical protein AAGH81_13495 [Bacteroidota bacterium]
MKKNNYTKSVALALLGMSLLHISCEDGDQVVDQITDDIARGAILRTITFETNEIAVGSSDYVFEVEFEIEDEENGTKVTDIEVYLSFDDNTVEEGETDLSGEEVFIETISTANFTVGPFGFPRGGYSMGLAEMLATFSLQPEDIYVTGGDEFTFRFEILLDDGRSFSLEDNTSTLTGAFLNSPFVYSTIVVCPPLAPSPGTWTINMTDDYGDGWNGASFDITIDDTVFNIALEGAAGTETIEVEEGASSIAIVFNSGEWDPEIGATIVSSTGTVIVEFIADPSQGQEQIHPFGVNLIDYCDLTLDL